MVRGGELGIGLKSVGWTRNQQLKVQCGLWCLMNQTSGDGGEIRRRRGECMSGKRRGGAGEDLF